MKLETIKIPSKVIQIMDEAFYGCSNLKEVHIPSNIEKIADDAFKDCENLSGIIFE